MIEKVFKAYDVRGRYPAPLNEEMAWRIGHATAQYLRRSRQNLPADKRVTLEQTICVGRDMRKHSPVLSAALIEGIRSTGTSAIDIGPVDTPLLSFAINHLDCVGGIQVTASHNAAEYNGLVIGGPKARPIGSATGLDDIRRIAMTIRVGKTGIQGSLETFDLWPAYRKHVLQFLDLRRKMRVVVDASNGMAGKMIPAVFGDLPQLEIVPVLFEMTGEFAHPPNPLIESNLAQLKAKVAEIQPDMGVCFDGDADRCAFVDQNGVTIPSDLITALIAHDFLRHSKNRGATVVYDLRCSHIVPDVIGIFGGTARRERVGRPFIRRTIADTGAIFGGELSGQFYFRDNFGADSGAIALARAVSILSAQTKPFSEVVRPLRKYAHSGELNFATEEKDARLRDLTELYKKQTIDYLDGITIDLGDWWFNVRKSNTESLLRLNAEAATPQLLQEKLSELRKILGEPVAG